MRPLPQWSTIGVEPSQRPVRATLHWDGKSADVIADHTVASLRPLLIVTSVEAGKQPIIKYVDCATGALLGVLTLERHATIEMETSSLAVYRVAGGKHYCLEWPYRAWNTWLQNRLMRKNRASPHSALEPAEVQKLMIAYLLPRPVVLVSVDAPGHRNMFPMDLIGSLEGSGFFSLALRTTNVSAPIMRDVRRVVLSSAPAAMKSVVYKLSEQHRRPLVDWHALPFPVRPSRELHIPAVAAAVRIRELTIVHSQELGSHTLFLARTVSEEHLTDDTQLHHTAGFHQAYRHRRGMSFAEI